MNVPYRRPGVQIATIGLMTRLARRTFLRTIGTGLGAGVLAGCGVTQNGPEQPTPTTAPVIVIPTSTFAPSAAPTVVDSPTPLPPTVVPPTATNVPDTATPAPSSTALMTPTETERPIATATEKPAEKNPLPRYAAFIGSLKGGGSFVGGALALASIPDGDADSVFVYGAVRYQSGKQFWAAMAKPDSIQGRSFQVHSNRISAGGIHAVVDSAGKTMTGQEDFFGSFQLNYTGSGRAAVIEAIKRAKALGLNLGPGGAASIDEVKLFVDFTKWPEA